MFSDKGYVEGTELDAFLEHLLAQCGKKVKRAESRGAVSSSNQLLQGAEGETRGLFLHPECLNVCRPHCPQIKHVVSQGEISEDSIRKLRDRLVSVQDASADRRLQIEEVRRAFILQGIFITLS